MASKDQEPRKLGLDKLKEICGLSGVSRLEYEDGVALATIEPGSVKEKALVDLLKISFVTNMQAKCDFNGRTLVVSAREIEQSSGHNVIASE